MKQFHKFLVLPLAATVLALGMPLLAQQSNSSTVEQFARDPNQSLDADYTQRIQKYTTDPRLNSPLTNYLPASKTVPTPAKVLGDVSGAPGILPYAEDVYHYFRLLEQSTHRVKVFTIGHTEEGREMIAAAVGDESLLAKVDENQARLAQLADPRTINQDDKVARTLAAQSFPIYYITGTIHSPETGAPTALMELAYRLAVDNAPYIQYIRTHMIVLVTPVVEVDGRDRMVDIYKWHRAHPKENWPRLLYWGHYVAHDNNRDAMGMTLDLTRNVLDTYLHWHAQVLHDLHESVPFLYDNTVGDGPYNAWVDPLLADEWAALGWNNVQQLQSFGMPGAFTHGNFDTWSPGYLMFLAAMHNGISRLYETFGNGGADTEKRILSPDEYSRTWYRPNPPYPVVEWSQRDNNNYEESALLSTLSYFSHNAKHFLDNYYLKSKRSVEKPQNSGPAAYVLRADESARNRQMQLLEVLQKQHIEISRLTEAATVNVQAAKRSRSAGDDAKNEPDNKKREVKPETLGAGSWVIRMDQPYSRAADALLDRQYWSPDDPQKHPYDDTGWSFGDLFDARVLRVTDDSILSAKMERVQDFHEAADGFMGGSSVYAINNSAQVSLLSLRFALKQAEISITDNSFDADGRHFAAGSLLIGGVDDSKLQAQLAEFHLKAYGLSSKPSVQTHPARVPRIAFLHTWLATQTEGWWRLAFDSLKIPYSYINTQTIGQESDLRAKYDVLIFAPVSQVSAAQIVSGLPMWGNALPWQKTELTPNLGKLDSTADMRPGLGFAGVAKLKDFVEKGGLLITSEDTAQFAIDEGLAPGVFIAPLKGTKVEGSIFTAVRVDHTQPVAYGYGEKLGVYSKAGMAFTVADMVTNRNILTEKEYKRPTGRGGPDDEDAPEGRKIEKPHPLPSPKPWQATPLDEEQARNNPLVIPDAYRANVIFRFAEKKQLLLSGLLQGGDSIAERPAVVNAHLGKGNVLLFAINPVYRGETIGSYAMVFNAILNFENLASNGASGAE